MKQSVRLVGVVAASCGLTVALSGCARITPMVKAWTSDGIEHEVANKGPLKVYGADRETLGPLVYQDLQDKPGLATFLTRHPEPDTIEVLGRRMGLKSYVLEFRRAGPCYRVRILPTSEGLVPNAQESCKTKIVRPPPEKTRPPRRDTPKVVSQPKPRSAPPKPRKPTDEQMLDCEIAPKRTDCQAFCAGGGSYAWCK